MLKLAAVKKTDVVCDLVCGGGHIVIAAARDYGCRSVGYEISRDLVRASGKQTELNNAASLATFECREIFDVHLSAVDVMTLYLLTRQNLAMIPKLNTMKTDLQLSLTNSPFLASSR